MKKQKGIIFANYDNTLYFLNKKNELVLISNFRNTIDNSEMREYILKQAKRYTQSYADKLITDKFFTLRNHNDKTAKSASWVSEERMKNKRSLIYDLI